MSTYEELVHLWLQAYRERRSAIWVAGKLGVSRQRVYQKVNKMRAEGVALPSLTTSSKSELDVEGLNKIIREEVNVTTTG